MTSLLWFNLLIKGKYMYMRYILKTPTDIYGHYNIQYFADKDLDEAVAKLVPGAFILDAFSKVGYGFKIIRQL